MRRGGGEEGRRGGGEEGRRGGGEERVSFDDMALHQIDLGWHLRCY